MIKQFLITLLFFTTTNIVFGQCAMCKAVAEDHAEQNASGINDGIYFIMIIPYIILFVVFRKKIGHLFRQIRDAKRDPIKDEQ